ncbi:MAG TPA: ankyrin repeat domain-containing protein [Allosphingosinicella sp.]|nr:ankyrin repeat domain-containing protein [Allosphingosinicella sp.]
MGKHFARAIAAAALVVAVPASAQGSDAYTFLKAVKERDGDKATSLISQPGTTVINTRDRGDGEGALHIVTRGRDQTWLAFLLAKGARPDVQNAQGVSPLSLAAQLGWVEGAELLLGRGASVDLANGRGETPLILAVQQRDLPMVRLLLSKGANPKRTDNTAGYSALDYASRDGARSASILKLLQAPPAAPANKPMGPKL